MTKFKNAWGKLPPNWRFVIRAAVVGFLAYAVPEVSDFDIDDPQGLLDAAKVAGGYILLGLFTPLEAFVGPAFAKPDVVSVPSPPAVNEDNV